MGFKGYVGLAVLALVAIFIAQNAAVVTVNLLFWKVSVSRALMILFVLIAGIVVGLVLPGLSRLGRHGHGHDRL